MSRIRTTVELDEDLVEWKKEVFPNTPIWAILNNLLRAFKEQYEQDPPPDYYVRGAKQLKEMIERDMKFME